MTIVGLYRYHVPRSWIKPSGNTLVLLEEMGGDPTKISFATKHTGSNLCLKVSESHPAPVDTWTSDSKFSNRTSPAVLSLKCPVSTQVISSIRFASFGTPTGSCGSFSHGRCNSARCRQFRGLCWPQPPLCDQTHPEPGCRRRGNGCAVRPRRGDDGLK